MKKINILVLLVALVVFIFCSGFTKNEKYSAAIRLEMEEIANEINMFYEDEIIDNEYIVFAMNSKDNALMITETFKEISNELGNEDLNTRIRKLIEKINNAPIEEKEYYFDMENSYRKVYTTSNKNRVIEELELTKREYKSFFEDEQVDGINHIIRKIKNDEIDYNVLEHELELYKVLDLPMIKVIGENPEYIYDFYEVDQEISKYYDENREKNYLLEKNSNFALVKGMSNCVGSSCTKSDYKDIEHKELKLARRISYSRTSLNKYREKEEKIKTKVTYKKETYYVTEYHDVRIVKVIWEQKCSGKKWWRVCYSVPKTVFGWGKKAISVEKTSWTRASEENVWVTNKVGREYNVSGKQISFLGDMAFGDPNNIIIDKSKDVIEIISYLRANKSSFKSIGCVAYDTLFDLIKKIPVVGVGGEFLDIFGTLICSNVYKDQTIAKNLHLYKGIIMTKDSHFQRNNYQNNFINDSQTKDDLKSELNIDEIINTKEKVEKGEIDFSENADDKDYIEINGIYFEPKKDDDSVFHQIGSHKNNIKLVSKYGYIEVIINTKGEIVKDNLVYGTYNFMGGIRANDINEKKDEISKGKYLNEHFKYDVLPYLVWGNTYHDISTKYIRLVMMIYSLI